MYHTFSVFVTMLWCFYMRMKLNYIGEDQEFKWFGSETTSPVMKKTTLKQCRKASDCHLDISTKFPKANKYKMLT